MVATSGAVAYALAWSSYDLRVGYRKDVTSEIMPAVTLRDEAGKQAIVSGPLGAALLSTATPMGLPEYSDAPFLPWVSAGLGLAGVVVGTVLAVNAERCDLDQCDAGGIDSTLGPFVVLQSAPLLASAPD